MSLIVGRVDQGKIILLGDTKLTFKNSISSNPYVNGCLKLYIVNDKLAFGFAGIVEQFEKALPNLLNCQSAPELADLALALKAIHSLDFDLIIAEIGVDHLTFVKGQNISHSAVGYIGDKDAFEKYQEYFTENKIEEQEVGRAYFQISMLPEPLWEDNLYSRMFNAFKQTLSLEATATVGGIAVPLCSHNGVFRYMHYVDIISDPLNLAEFSEKPKIIEFGTAEYGSFSIELSDTTPNGGSPQDIGFYFLQGGFGLIFVENQYKLKIPKIVFAENPAYWVLNTSIEYGSGVASGYMTPDHCGITGEQLLEQGENKKALFCYEQGKDAKDFDKRPAVYDRFMAGYAVSLSNNGRYDEAIAIIEATIMKIKHAPLCAHYDHLVKEAKKTMDTKTNS